MKNGRIQDKRLYLSNKQKDEIEAAIYNDTLETLYQGIPKTIEGFVSEEAIKELIGEEEYIHVPEQEEFILTRRGRIYNTERLKSVLIHYSGRNIRIYLKGKKREYPQLYEYAGWDYDPIKILKEFKKNKWEVRVQDNYKTFFESL